MMESTHTLSSGEIKSNMLYNIVFGLADYEPPSLISNYDNLYELIQPFILTKELYEKETTASAAAAAAIPVESLITLPPTESPIFTSQPVELHSILKEKTQIKPPTTRTPLLNDQCDPIFWCIYVLLNGISEYEFLRGRYINHITEEKQKIVNFLKSNDDIVKPFMKKSKITGVSMKEMLSEILSNEPIDFKNAPLFCLFYKIDIIFTNPEKRIYFIVECGQETAAKIHVEYSLKRSSTSTPSSTNKIKFMILSDETKIKQINEFYKIENPNKPLAAISNYKVDELKEIAQKVGIEIAPKMKKNEIYETISTYFHV